MCYEDIKLGRKLKAVITTTTTTASIKANGKRVGIAICCVLTETAELQAVTSAGVITVAIVTALDAALGSTNTPSYRYISLLEIGDLMFGEFRIVCHEAGGGSIIETWLDDGKDFKL